MIRPVSVSWKRFVHDAFRKLVTTEPLRFENLAPKMLPDAGGIYLITARVHSREEPYYVGRSKRLRRRIYTNHLMGPLANARLKKYLINSGECKGLPEAKKFLRDYCLVRWVEESDIRKRGAIEGYVTGLLFPKYGIYEEH